MIIRKMSRLFDQIDLFFLLGALSSFLASVGLWFLVDQGAGLFVGLWVPSILTFWVGIRVRLGQQQRGASLGREKR